jgi:hypothetical protein
MKIRRINRIKVVNIEQKQKDHSDKGDQTKSFSQYTNNLTRMYGLNPLSSMYKTGFSKVSYIQGPSEVDSNENPNYDNFRSRNCFAISQSPKRAGLKSYCRVKLHKSRLRTIGDPTSTSYNTLTTVKKDDEQVTMSNDYQININSIRKIPLQNDKARTIMFSQGAVNYNENIGKFVLFE